MKIKFKKLTNKATIPTKGRAGDACFDLYAAEDVLVEVKATGLVKTNIAVEIPDGYFGKLYTRSGMALKGYSVDGGVIDSNYRGDCGIIIRNHSSEDLRVHVGDRIAQLAIHKVEDVEFEEVDQLSDTVRGDAGYGSSGK